MGQHVTGRLVHGVSCPFDKLSMGRNVPVRVDHERVVRGASSHGASCDGVHCPVIRDFIEQHTEMSWPSFVIYWVKFAPLPGWVIPVFSFPRIYMRVLNILYTSG
jgi:hypothetical protein